LKCSIPTDNNKKAGSPKRSGFLIIIAYLGIKYYKVRLAHKKNITTFSLMKPKKEGLPHLNEEALLYIYQFDC